MRVGHAGENRWPMVAAQHWGQVNDSTIIGHPLAFLEFKHVEKSTWHTIPSDFAGVDAAGSH